MSSLNDKTLEMADKIIADIVNDQIKNAGVRQCDLNQFTLWDKKTCFDCGDEMPLVRIEMGRVRCVHCQSVAEKKGYS